MGDPLIKEAAEEIGTYQDTLMRGLIKANAPIYMIDGYFRLDKEWQNEQKSGVKIYE